MTRLSTFRCFLILLVSGIILEGWDRSLIGQDAVTAERLEEIFGGKEPATLAEVKAMQEKQIDLNKKVESSVVGVIVGEAAGSGVIVSADGYVMTAGHVSQRPNIPVIFILSDGRQVRGKTLGLNRQVDSGLMKITEAGPWPFLEIGISDEVKLGQWVVAMGHPGGYEDGRKPVYRLGRVLGKSQTALMTDCLLVGGDSGGPIFNMQGQVIGINSRINASLANNIHVPSDEFSENWDSLVDAKIWGRNGPGGAEPYVGLKVEEEDENVIVERIAPKSPAEEAGLEVGDVVLEVNGETIKSKEAMADLVKQWLPGDEITLKVRRKVGSKTDDKELELKVGAKNE
jgi:serine protease Do